MKTALILVIGAVLDLLFADPRKIPHPVVLIGKVISALSGGLRKVFPKTPAGETAAGTVLMLAVAAVSFLVPFLVIRIAGEIDTRIAFAIEALWCWQILAGRSLDKESRKVYDPVKAGDIPLARERLSMIVGRDTKDLSPEKIVKATVETIAENTSDGIIAPMIFILIGGVPLGFLYKAVNTLDSMVGYRNEEFMFFGRASARADDVLNFVPARITGLLMIPGAVLAGLDARGAARIFGRDRLKHSSPNSACPESAAAGALGLQLGGDNYYFGKLVKKPSIGDDLRPAEAEDIPRMIRLMYSACAQALIIGCAAAVLIDVM